MAMFDVILGDTHCLLDLRRRSASLRITGHWSGANALKMGGIFAKSMAQIQDKLVLNLEGCRSMDAPALSSLLRQQEQLAALGKRMELVDVPGKLLAMLEGTQLLPAPQPSGTAVLERV
jgi:ABC-type transporter Mla MlaB component